MAPRQMCVPKWTLVQHSGYGYGQDGQFSRAVEPREIGRKEDGGIMTAKQFDELLTKIKVEGGLVYDTYREAMVAEDVINGVTGDRPFLNVAGEFSHKVVIDSLRLYIPVREVVG